MGVASLACGPAYSRSARHLPFECRTKCGKMATRFRLRAQAIAGTVPTVPHQQETLHSPKSHGRDSFPSRSTIAGQLSSPYPLPSRLRTRGAILWRLDEGLCFLELYASAPTYCNALIHNVPFSRQYSSGMCTLYSRRRPPCCDRNQK